ncbi:AraC family transcriptional regulator [Fredinandcohnia sp. QZ13]|uniref:helix-turn-helix transcriptional regulator n=1 Tax=Fredinandcohnia sp. QZ13 TaxID=3073144 RepID=UPI00285346DB|nr:AraC family transcriptional regulator [Fredinandcohnia sp. QZ13]MDR4887534.1 AraC family transcriptional regulator [Fredinandcohnia sp. QZ13]
MELINSIFAERRTYGQNQDTHSHYYAQLILPQHGRLSIRVGENEFRLNDEMVLFIPPRHTHTFHSIKRNEFLVLDIPDFMLSKREFQNKVISCEFNDQWKGIRYLIQNEINQKPINSTALKELYPYISYYLLQEYQPTSIKYIHENYGEKLTIEMLASLEHYNRSYYSEWFQKETGKTPFAYIQEVRMNKAKDLLLHTNLSLLHIAIQVGLEYQSSLTRLFLKHEGITPSQFRKQRLR